MKRREFIRNTGWFVVGAAIVPGCIPGSDSSGDSGEPDAKAQGADLATRHSFPQGVASGDPRATSVVLWTRVVAASGDASAAISLRVQVATDAACVNRVVDHAIVATQGSDHTVRV